MKYYKRFSNYAILFCILWCTVTITDYQAFRYQDTIRHDQFAYYAFLPATFIYHDLNYGFMDSIPCNRPSRFYPTITPEGKRINKVTMGMSILLAPAFAIAHVSAYLEKRPQDGYCRPYVQTFFYSALLFHLLSLLLLRKVLSRFYSDTVIGFTLISLSLGTNLFFYVVHEPMMAHAYNFFLFSLFLHWTLRWYETLRFKYMIGLGVILGLIALIRPTNIIIGLFFLLYDIKNLNCLKNRFALLGKKWMQLIPATILSLAVIFPQLYLWKTTTGSWIFNSYGENEYFYWSEPAIIQGLFGFCKGWFIYTPMMFLAILGFFYVKKYAPQFFLPLMIYTPLNIYIVLSWWSWWYGGSFGHRAFVESAAPLSLCLAAFIAQIFSIKNKFLKTSAFLPVVFFIFLNLFQTFQFKRACIRWNGMTQEMYWRVFLRANIPDEEKNQIFELAKEPSR
jgi:hypothetical protein